MKSAICVIAKEENNYIREWVEYNKAIGFDNILLYDNNDVDGETFDDVISDYIESGYVIYRNVRGKQGYHQTSYQICYDEFGGTYDWIAFFDVDEFIEVDKTKYQTVNDFFSDKMFSDAECIRISWKYFDDNDLVTVKDGNYNIRERFTRSIECPYNNETKGILRGGLKNIIISQREYGAHIICVDGVSNAVNCRGDAVENDTFVCGKVWENAWLCHYRYKTIEEFLTHKRKRGWTVGGLTRDAVLNNYLTIDSFWHINQRTKEKEEYLKKFLYQESLKAKRGVMLCCIGKNENRYARDYVEWYKNLGVTHICLYDNNDADGEHFEDVIGDYIKDGFVEVIDYRGRKVCQQQAYTECYNNNKDKYDWIIVSDFDEYLVIENGATGEDMTINQYLSLKQFDNYDLIHINWLIFGDNDSIEVTDESPIERFIEPMPVNTCIMYNFPENCHIKSIIRGGLEGVQWAGGGGCVHTPSPHNLRCCNDSGEPCNGNSPFNNISYRFAAFKHFTTKTAREYCDKLRRGYADQEVDGSFFKDRVENYFFKVNKVTREKVDIFKEELGVDVSYLLPYEGPKSTDTQIFTLCYTKKDFKFLDDAVITPLQVGAANGSNVCVLKDNTGHNISTSNFFYIENTGTYWIWKNVTDAKIKGQMQYRRPLEGINDAFDFEKCFEQYDVITCEPFHHPDHKESTEEEPMVIPADTVEEGYAFSHCVDDLYILEMAVKMLYPDYAADWDKYIKHGEDLYYSNGFIMRAEDYDQYCVFLFDCLRVYLSMAGITNKETLYEHVRYNIEVGKYKRYGDSRSIPEAALKWQTEIGGFLSERLWTLWLLHNFKKERILTKPYIKMEKEMFT